MFSPATVWLISALTATYFRSGAYCYDYCKIEREHCSNKRHIACHPEQMLSKNKGKDISTNWTAATMTSKMRKLILDAHNERRNLIACGEGYVKDKSGRTYPPAVRMREVVWDKELEFIARKHAEQCVFAHDECRKSSKYPSAGQNLAMKKTNRPHTSALDDVVNLVQAWFQEHRDASISEVDSVGSTNTKKAIGHFTVMVNERVTRIGCAFNRCWLSKNPDLIYYMHLYTCNYSYTNMRTIRMYTKGKEPASECADVESKRSLNYRCLCTPSDFKIESK